MRFLYLLKARRKFLHKRSSCTLLKICASAWLLYKQNRGMTYDKTFPLNWKVPQLKKIYHHTETQIEQMRKILLNVLKFCLLKHKLKREEMKKWCGILKSSFNNRRRRIESLRIFSNLFLNCSTTTPLNASTRSTRRDIGGASNKFITPKEKTGLIIWKRWG